MRTACAKTATIARIVPDSREAGDTAHATAPIYLTGRNERFLHIFRLAHKDILARTYLE